MFGHKASRIKHLEGEITKLANYIMAEVPGEPSESQGACDTAIRVIRGFLSLKEVDKLSDNQC